MASKIFVFIEQNAGEIKKVGLELLSEGRKVVNAAGGELCAVLMGENVADLADKLNAYGPDKVYVVENAALASYTNGAYSDALAAVLKEQGANLILIGNTAVGKDLAPVLAQKLEAGMVSDCTGIAAEGDKVVFTRPIYAGKAITKVAIKSDLGVATIRPNVMDVVESASTPEVIKLDVAVEASKTVVKEVIKQATDKVLLTEANIIVSGGRGMGGSDFSVIEELADLLGAAVGASRSAVDAGWRSSADQVGQTGKVVSPNLYIACGISGAMQHLAGMSTSKVIVAINKDEEANIFNFADYGIVNDLFKVVPAITAELKK